MTARLGKVYAGAAAHWDARRNTSQVRLPDPENARQLRRLLERSHDEPWYRWIENRQDGIHDHAAVRSDGTRAACPVYGCSEPLEP